ncbi:protein asteroid homolog 1-like [Cydia strobilella]|uniref:protein asteroid homolog 1-like n=1 Tax=Cydia strobilella TaxID=1100964 RepID=UPI003007E4CF
MLIKSFASFVESNELTTFALHDTPVVVDGQNFFYKTYEQSGLSTACGIEGDGYARYLRQYLGMFQKAKVKCYFLFKGGHENMEKRLTYNNNKWPTQPVFMKEIYKEILDEMGFKYFVCEYESKRDVIELAQHLNCPVISRDIEFCFSGLKYIPSTTLKFDTRQNYIDCGYFLLADFLANHRLTEEKLAIFIALRNERNIPGDIFMDFLTHLRAPLIPYHCNKHLIKYLSLYNRETVMKTIFKFISAEDKKIFIEEEANARQLTGRRESGGFGAACMMEPRAARVALADPRWFAKGVASGQVHINYINLYRSQVYYGAGPIPGFDNPILLSLNIIYYAYDLLTDFKNEGFTLIYETNVSDEDKKTMEIARTHNISRPAYDAEVCVFENGWDSVRPLGLLEHFARSTLHLESLRHLELAPEPARLVMLALAYYSRHRPSAPTALPAAVLLTYVMLDLIDDKPNNNNLAKPFDRKLIFNSTMDSFDATPAECRVAAAVMKEYYLKVPDRDFALLDQALLHALAEFKSCLLQLSALNTLCGSELPPPMFSRTFNGTLAYNLLYAATHAPNQPLFLDNLLSPAPTVYAFFKGLLEIYNHVL